MTRSTYDSMGPRPYHATRRNAGPIPSRTPTRGGGGSPAASVHVWVSTTRPEGSTCGGGGGR